MNISESLLEWYYVNHRKLPWRETDHPYAIWVSEVMLQQTQVDTVIDYYNRFLQSYPTIKDLANADEDSVYKLWEGLGYYSRARNLMRCAKIITEQYNGQFPSYYDEIIKLPGIGPYTAGAILSIAYNLPYPAVDGNVMRVIARIFKIEEDIALPATRKIFEKKVIELLPEDRRHFNQALMELGAIICTPKNPRCSICPVKIFCKANKYNIWSELPVKRKKIKKSVKQIAAAYVLNKEKFLITKRNEKGLLNGLWGLPYVEYNDKDNPVSLLAQLIYKEYGFIVEYKKIKAKNSHVFTHIKWNTTLFQFELFDDSQYNMKEGHEDYQIENDQARKEVNFKGEISPLPLYEWVSLNEFEKYPFPTAFKKLL